MQKSFRELLGIPILDKVSKGLLGKISDFIVNPANGEILAFFTRKDRKLILPTVDVARVTSEAIFVEDPEAMATPDEIIRISEVIQLHTPIFGNKVFTVSRQYLGEVVDFRFETNGWVLTKLDVAKKILGIPTEQKLINSSQIIRIKSNEITVRDAVVKLHEKKSAVKEKVPDLTTATFKIKD